MGQVTGRKVQFNIADGSTFGSSASVTSTERAYVLSNSVAGTIARITDETLSGFRGQPASIPGNTDVAGSVPVNVAPESIGRWLKHLLGPATVYAPVTVSSPIAGVEVLFASAGSAAGVGTLTWTASGTTLTWAEQGDTAGSAVDVSGGGRFTILSNSGESVVVNVTPADFGANDTATVTVVAGAYEHVFTVSEPPAGGLVMEANLGADITAGSRWIQYVGGRVRQCQFQMGASGFLQAAMDLIFSGFSNTAGAALDASPDDFGHSAFSAFGATLKEAGAVIATARTLQFTVNNDVDDTDRTIGSQGRLNQIEVGSLQVTGSAEFTFSDPVLLNKAIAGTETSLELALTKGTGAGTANNERLVVSLPHMLYQATTPGVNGPRGLVLPLNFNTHRASGVEHGLEFRLRNTRASI